MKKILLIGITLLLTACAVPYASNYGGGYYPNRNVQRPYYSGGNYYNNNARNYRGYNNNGKVYKDGYHNNGGDGYREGRRYRD